MRTILILTLAVTYETNGASISDLEDNLLAVANAGCREGWFTGDTNAEVIIADPTVTVLP